MPAPALREVQDAFWRSLARAPGSGEAPAPDPALLAAVSPTPPLARAERVRVYADMYFLRLLDVLREDFPRVAGALGEERFEALAGAYLARHPSRHPSVRHVGAEFATFLAARPLPAWLADLARLEWTRLEVFDEADDPVMTLDALRSVPADDWPGLRFAPVAALRTFVAGWPVHRLWQEESAAGAAPARTALRVWRDRALGVYHTAMDDAEEVALAALVAGGTFAAVCEPFDDPVEAGALLLRWIEDGIIARVLR